MKIDTREDPDKWGASGGGTLLKSSFDFVLCINMLHFCEWTACEVCFLIVEVKVEMQSLDPAIQLYWNSGGGSQC